MSSAMAISAWCPLLLMPRRALTRPMSSFVTAHRFGVAVCIQMGVTLGQATSGPAEGLAKPCMCCLTCVRCTDGIDLQSLPVC